jgi:autotransporter-associated beta strand protein
MPLQKTLEEFMNTKTLSCRARLSWAGLLLALAPAALAGDVLKTNNTDNLNLGTSWVAGTPPGATDVAVWDATVTSANGVLLGASANWAGIRITNVGGAVGLGDDGNTLTLGASGIDMSGAAQDLALNCILALANSQTWNAGTKTLIVTNANTSSSGLTLTGGAVVAGNDAALGAGTLTLSGCGLTATNGTRTIANPLVVAAGTSNNLYGFHGGRYCVFEGPITGSGTIGGYNSAGGNTTFKSDLSGFTGTIWHDNSGNSFQFQGTAPAAYDGSQAHFVTSGSTTPGAPSWFMFFGADGYTVRLGELSGPGGHIASVYTMTYEIGALNTSTTYQGHLTQNGCCGPASLLKVGTGTLTLTYPNTYAGSTTVGGGTLVLSSAQTGTGAITVNDHTTLGVTVSGASQLKPEVLYEGTGGAGATNDFYGVSSTSTAPVQAGTLSLTSPTTINILSGTLVAGQTYPLIGYTTLDGPGSFVLGALPVGVTATVVTNGTSIALAVTGVLAPPTVTGGTMLPGGSFQIMFGGPAGQSFKVLGTNVITAPLATWPVLLNGTFGLGGPVATNFIDSGAATNRVGFYRIVSP